MSTSNITGNKGKLVEKAKSKILDSDRVMKHVENLQYLKFLDVIRKITHRRFIKSSRRTRWLTHIGDEIYNCKKSCTPFMEGLIEPELVEEREQELQDSIRELKQAEKEIFENQELLDINLSYDKEELERIRTE